MDLGVLFTVIGGIAAVIALGWAIWSQFTNKLKPPTRPASVLVPGWDHSRVSGFTERRVPYVNVTFHNKGETTARDLRITVDTATRDDGAPWEYLLTLEKDALAWFTVPVVPVRSNAKNDHIPIAGVADIIDPVVTVDWMDYSDEPRRTESWTISGTGF